MGPRIPVRSPLMTRTGATLPVSFRRKTRIDASPLLATAISSCARSTSSAIGQFKPVSGPWIRRTGATSPLASAG